MKTSEGSRPEMHEHDLIEGTPSVPLTKIGEPIDDLSGSDGPGSSGAAVGE